MMAIDRTLYVYHRSFHADNEDYSMGFIIEILFMFCLMVAIPSYRALRWLKIIAELKATYMACDSILLYIGLFITLPTCVYEERKRSRSVRRFFFSFFPFLRIKFKNSDLDRNVSK